MADEKILTVNLSKILGNKPNWKKKISSARVVRDFLLKNSKAEDIKIDEKLNEILTKGSIKKIRIKLTKQDEKTFKAELLM